MSADESLGLMPSENPYVVEHGGFYRRWFSMISDMAEFKSWVDQVKGTNEETWVPLWKKAGTKFERLGDVEFDNKNYSKAKDYYLTAKIYFSIGRFPGNLSDVKHSISDDCIRAYSKANQFTDPPIKIIDIPHEGKNMRCHLRIPNGKGPFPAVLIMCGSDVFKEDRGWAGDFAINNSMASLVMDAPGTGENPVSGDPSSVSAWIAAIDYLASIPEVNPERIGAFGISRGGYSVMQLAGTYPKMVKAVVAIAGHPFGYEMSDVEKRTYVSARNKRSEYVFGPLGGGLSFPKWSIDYENDLFDQWALPALGVLDNIKQPILMINGKLDHLAPIGNIYFMLENGPCLGREARIYPDAGHCAFKYFNHWGEDSFKWLNEKLNY
jgi:dienelactone hydrolase